LVSRAAGVQKVKAWRGCATIRTSPKRECRSLPAMQAPACLAYPAIFETIVNAVII